MIQLSRIWPIALTIMTIATSLSAQDITAEAVNRSIDRGVRFLLSQQNSTTGRWSIGEKATVVRGGSTVLCTLALLNAGVPQENKSLQKAFKAMEDIPPERMSVYVISLRIMVYCEANPKKYRNLIRRDVNWLINRQSQNGKHTGGWNYAAPGETADASNSQYALLALHEAQQAGVKVGEEVWQRAKSYWAQTVDPKSGGGFYKVVRNRGPSGAMTCAAISSLIIVEENLLKASDQLNGDRVQCCGADNRMELVEKSINWLSQNFSVASNPMPRAAFPKAKFYYLYGMERAGRLAGQRFFGDNDWYRLGVAELIRIQNQGDGSWRGSPYFAEDAKLIATSFALLFLAKGRRPVVLGHYKHSGDWNRHRKGVHYLTRAIEKAWSQKLNWQTVNGEKATVDDLLETPVLFMSGRDVLNLNVQQKRALKEYVENGGFIFAEACQGDGCGNEAFFDQKFRDLVADLFPNSPLQPLDAAHPIWQAHYKLIDVDKRPLLGVQTSCRTSIVYCPTNLSCFWQLNQPAWDGAFPPVAQRDIDHCTRLGVNVVAYATGRELKEKLDRPRVASEGDGGLASRVLEIPKLSHTGGSDDAPNAWRNVLNRLRFDMKMRVTLKRKFVEPKLEQMAKYPILFVHGRNRFEFSDDQRQAIRAYVDRGGFIFADSICASQPFADSFRKEMKTIFPDEGMEVVGKEHPIWTDQFAGYDVRTVILRSPTVTAEGRAAYNERETYPLMESVVMKNGRMAVLFSPYDLSCALENSGLSECRGYQRDDAAKIGVNVVLFALQQMESKPASDALSN